MKYINDSLKLGTIVEQRIKERDLKQLESAKMDLMERMGTSVGLHTAGVPFISSALLSVVSLRTVPHLPTPGGAGRKLLPAQHNLCSLAQVITRNGINCRGG
ncbi:hypothetical protein PGN50_02530 [Klebsiella aerogenes]